jgi:all-trans-8'-apo-beta-carotenal 15,15'-oxygenase
MNESRRATALSRRSALRALAAVGFGSPWLNGRAASSQNAWRRSYAALDGSIQAGLKGRLETAAIAVQGRVPAALHGTLYRAGPGRFRLGATQYTHWFDGDGMVQAFRIAEGKASHLGVLLRTPKLIEEEAAGRFLYSGFGTEIADARTPRNADSVNVANINLLAMNGGKDLYALWEGGSALQIDPDSLAVQEFKAWSPETAGAPFSAHPRRGADGTLWNFGYAAGSGKLILYEIAPDGRLQRQALVDAPQADMVHDLAVTEHNLVFLLMPLRLKAGAKPLGDLNRYEWQRDASLIAMVVSKADFSVKRFDLPNGGLFHIGNAWEEGGVIKLSYARYSRFLEHLRSLDVTHPTEPPELLARWMQVEIDLAKGRASQIDMGLSSVEFPSFDLRLTGARSKFTVLMQRRGRRGGHSSIGQDTVLTLAGERVQHYQYEAGWIAEEHLYVARGTREGEGWVLGTAYDSASERTALSIFDASHVADGPMARLQLDYGLPLGLHGQFVGGA